MTQDLLDHLPLYVGYDQKLWDRKLEEQERQLSVRLERYKKRNQGNPEKVLKDAVQGEVGEFCVAYSLKKFYGKQKVVQVPYNDEEICEEIMYETGIDFGKHDPDIFIKRPNEKRLYIHVKTQTIELANNPSFGMGWMVQSNHHDQMKFLSERKRIENHYFIGTVIDTEKQSVKLTVVQRYPTLLNNDLFGHPKLDKLKGNKRTIYRQTLLDNGINPVIDLPPAYVEESIL